MGRKSSCDDPLLFVCNYEMRCGASVLNSAYRDSTEDYWHMSWGPEDKSLAEWVAGPSSSTGKLRHEVAATNSFKEQNQPLPKVPAEAAAAAPIPGTEAATANTTAGGGNEQVVAVDVHAAASTRM